MAMPSVRNRREVYLTVDQVLAVAATCPPDTAAVVRLSFFCGLRWLSELIPRTQDDVVRVDGDTWLRVGKTKTGRPRMVPVHPDVVGDLAHLPVRRNTREMYEEFRVAAAAQGLAGTRMHDLRHSLASAIISEGGTLSDVQGALHHESVQSSARYAHLYPERLKAVLFRVGKRQKVAHPGDDKEGRPKPKKCA
jgi:integrase